MFAILSYFSVDFQKILESNALLSIHKPFLDFGPIGSAGRFDVYWLQTNKQTDTQAKYKYSYRYRYAPGYSILLPHFIISTIIDL